MSYEEEKRIAEINRMVALVEGVNVAAHEANAKDSGKLCLDLRTYADVKGKRCFGAPFDPVRNYAEAMALQIKHRVSVFCNGEGWVAMLSQRGRQFEAPTPMEAICAAIASKAESMRPSPRSVNLGGGGMAA